MREASAAAGTAAFFILAPGVVAGLVPWCITGWTVAEPRWPTPVRVIGVGLLVPAVAALVHAFVRFVQEGRGTPAPVAPTERLVVGGLYRHVRNPMYIAVLAAIVGQALWTSQPRLAIYGIIVQLAVAAFVRWYEEPTLLRTYGAQYEAYRRAVPRWRPRLRPWRGPGNEP